MAKTDNYEEILKALRGIHEQHPTQNLGRHLSLALSDYPDLFGLTDKEFLFAINKYSTELELDIVSDSKIENISNESYGYELSDDEEEDWEDEL
jgi:hypothetical protein